MSVAGIQVSSIRPYLQTPEDVRSSFEKLAATGCKMVQLQWISMDVPVEFIAQILKDTGMVSVSTQDFYQVVTENLSYFLKLNECCGSTHLCVSGIPEEYMTAEGCRRFGQELARFAGQLAKEGMVLSFHPRTQEYRLLDGRPAMEILLENTPDDICLGLDLYHVINSGQDPVAWINRYQHRIDFVHFKDKTVLPDGTTKLCPIGQGVTDWAPVVRACLEADIPWAFAEQESWQKDAFVCMDENFQWMLKQGFTAR